MRDGSILVLVAPKPDLLEFKDVILLKKDIPFKPKGCLLTSTCVCVLKFDLNLTRKVSVPLWFHHGHIKTHVFRVICEQWKTNIDLCIDKICRNRPLELAAGSTKLLGRVEQGLL